MPPPPRRTKAAANPARMAGRLDSDAQRTSAKIASSRPKVMRYSAATATTRNRTAQVFSSDSSMAASSSRVRIARRPVEAMPLTSPRSPVDSRFTRLSRLAAGDEEADQGAHGGADADGTPRIRADVFVGGVHRLLSGVLDLRAELAEHLLGVVQLGLDLGLHLGELGGALALDGPQQLLGIRYDVLDVAGDRVGIRVGAC